MWMNFPSQTARLTKQGVLLLRCRRKQLHIAALYASRWIIFSITVVIKIQATNILNVEGEPMLEKQLTEGYLLGTSIIPFQLEVECW